MATVYFWCIFVRSLSIPTTLPLSRRKRGSVHYSARPPCAGSWAWSLTRKLAAGLESWDIPTLETRVEITQTSGTRTSESKPCPCPRSSLRRWGLGRVRPQFRTLRRETRTCVPDEKPAAGPWCMCVKGQLPLLCYLRVHKVEKYILETIQGVGGS